MNVNATAEMKTHPIDTVSRLGTAIRSPAAPVHSSTRAEHDPCSRRCSLAVRGPDAEDNEPAVQYKEADNDESERRVEATRPDVHADQKRTDNERDDYPGGVSASGERRRGR